MKSIYLLPDRLLWCLFLLRLFFFSFSFYYFGFVLSISLLSCGAALEWIVVCRVRVHLKWFLIFFSLIRSSIWGRYARADRALLALIWLSASSFKQCLRKFQLSIHRINWNCPDWDTKSNKRRPSRNRNVWIVQWFFNRSNDGILHAIHVNWYSLEFCMR